MPCCNSCGAWSCRRSEARAARWLFDLLPSFIGDVSAVTELATEALYMCHVDVILLETVTGASRGPRQPLSGNRTEGARLGDGVRQIQVGDRAVACGVHRGEVIMVARSRAWVLLRVDGGEPTRSGYLLCRPAEVDIMNGWWARRLRPDGHVGRRAWARGTARPVTAGREAPLPDAGNPSRRHPEESVAAPADAPLPSRSVMSLHGKRGGVGRTGSWRPGAGSVLHDDQRRAA